MIGTGAGTKTTIAKWTIDSIAFGIIESIFISPYIIDILFSDGLLIKFLSSVPGFSYLTPINLIGGGTGLT